MDRLFLIIAIVGVIIGSIVQWWTSAPLSAQPRLTSAHATSPSTPAAGVTAIAEVGQPLAAFTHAVGNERSGSSVTISILLTFLGLVLVFAFVLFGITFVGRGMAAK